MLLHCVSIFITRSTGRGDRVFSAVIDTGNVEMFSEQLLQFSLKIAQTKLGIFKTRDIVFNAGARFGQTVVISSEFCHN